MWPTLARWISDDVVSLRRLEALQRAAADWAENGRRGDFLIHREHRLADAEALVGEPRFAARLEDVDRNIWKPVEKSRTGATLRRRR